MIDRKRARELAERPPGKKGGGRTRERRILPWQVPYATISAFLESKSIEEREERRRGLNGALRDFRRSVFASKRPYRGGRGKMVWDGTTEILDPALQVALMMMLQAICANPVIDDETREGLEQAFNRIIDLKH